ncbi:hypothetical protein KC19_9G161300 [Ceratodon purpureus]|uniref:Uncharacterized protein n=1 Tax=Ceratodon purpureus TaxID=3225 RepID=A0A8T0GW40_CERPU|nr:hypothetical protein KC19_9G161300 [Ceratodon purpureus]
MADREAQELGPSAELEGLELAHEGEEGEQEEEAFVITEQLDEETQNLAAGLASRHSDELLHALQEFLKLLAIPKRGGRVLRQYVLASPKCAELVSAWELGVGAPTAVPLMLLLAELLRHPRGKGEGKAMSGDRQKAKALVVVQSRLDKLARVIGRGKIKDVYSHLGSKQRSRQKAALKLLSSIVLRGKLLAVDVATGFDFTLEALKKLAQHPFKAAGQNKNEGLLHQSTRYFFIEFALSFLVVGDPGLLRWILQKRPLYAGVLHGLAKDGEATIIQVLRVFQEKVMAPASLVPAGLQSVLFGDVALEQLARIAGDELFGESADVAYETLMALCTDPSHGLCPEYASPWESVNVKAGAHGGNQGRLLRLLLRLRVTEAVRHRELLLTTARIRPRLAAAYLDAVPYSLEPRPSPTWFTIMSLVADLVHISSTPPPFVDMALRGLPIPSPDGPLVRNNLRHFLPRALTKVALNRGLQHADVLVKHASLRLLLEALLSLELLLDGAYAAAESSCSQVRAGSSSNRDETLKTDDQESTRLQWLGLVENIQDIMRATLPDPNILLLINSSINMKSSSLKESDGSLKRTQSVVEARAGKRRKKDEGYSVEDDDGAHLSDSNSNMDNEVDEQEENSSALETLAQIWGSEAISSAKGLTESLLHAKVLEILAAYQRVLPVAFADKGFDPFKLLPSDPLQLSLAQQKAFLSLLLATTGAPRNVSHSNRTAYRLVEAGGSGSIYKHVKPLLKLMIGSTVDQIRDSTHLLASRIMVSTGAFESNTWESTLWLDHLFRLEGKSMNTGCDSEDNVGDDLKQHVLGSIGECVVGFVAEAVGSVGRTLYKYFDQLFSLLSAHSLGEESSEHSKDLSGSMVPEFGPFVLCALEHTLRVVRSDSKSMTLPQRSAIVLYVAGVLNDLLRMQTDSRALGIIITSLLSPELGLVTGNPDKSISTLGIEWAPLQALYLEARLFLSGGAIVASPAIQMPSLKSSESSGQLNDVITACRESSEDDPVRLRKDLVSAMVCASLQEVKDNFFQLVEVISKLFGQSTPILITLCGLHCKLLTEVQLSLQSVKKSKDQAMGRQLLVADLLSLFSSNSSNLVVSALDDSSSSLRKQAISVYNFLKSLPFSVLFSAIMHGAEGKALTFEILSAALNSSFSAISVRDRLVIMRMILSCIQQLALSALESLDKKQRLDICFTYLKRLVAIPKILDREEGNDTVSKEILLCKDIITKSLAHPAIAEFCLCPTATEASSGKHRKVARLLDEYTMDYLKFLLDSCSAIDLHGKSESVAEVLGSLQETTFQACKPFIQQAMKLFLLKREVRVAIEDETTFSRDFQLIQSFILELAGYADPKHFLFFLSDLISSKNGRTPSGVSPSTVFLKFAQLFCEKWHQIEQRSKWNAESSVSLPQETLVDVFRHVVNEVLEDATDDGDHCLLSALQISTSASEIGCSSTSSQFALLVSVTPIGVINYCIQHPTVVRGNIARVLVQTSIPHRHEFGKLLCKGTGEEMSEKDGLHLKMASRFLEETESQRETTNFSLSNDDLLLLLPAAKAFLCKYHSSSMTRVVVHVASTYLKLLTTHAKRWDEFVLQLVNLNELGLGVPKMLSEHIKIEELTGSYFNDMLVVMRKCLAICPLSSKKRFSLLRKILPKVGLSFGDLQISSFQGTEADVSTLFFQLYGKAAVARQILLDIEAQAPEELNAAMSVSKQQKLRSLMAETVMRFVTGLASTLTLIFKVISQMTKHSASVCIPGSLNVLGALEEYLQLQLVEVVESIDTTGAEAEILSLFESYAKTCLRYKFGKVEGMKVLRALAMRLADLSDDHTAKRKDTAASVLELVLSHSQFVPYIVSCGTTSRPLPVNLGRQAGKGTVLSSLPSIISLVGSPIVPSTEKASGGTSDMEITSISEFADPHTDNGIDPLEVSEGSQLALLQLVRSLFQLKMHQDSGILSSEDKVTIEELLSLLLAAYGATTIKIDTEIYALMCELEFYGGPGAPGLAGMDYLWGEAALKRRKAKVEKSQHMDEDMDTDENLLEARKRTFKEDLTLDPKRCGLSVLCFSTVAQHAVSLGIPELGAKSKKVFPSDVYDSEEHHLRVAAYDPRFILRFALHGLSEGFIDTEEFVCLGLLALAITSLSSSEEDMRKLGYKILAKYLASLEEGSNFKGQPQIRMLLNYVKNAVTEEWQQLPFVLMLFAAESSCILMHPENPHFMTITRYLLKGPALDLEYVPLFHSMFGSGSPRYRSERLWMLRLLACGLTSSRDSRVFRRQFVLEILMSFYSSPLADSFTRKWVLQVLMKATRIRGCVQALVERSGFLPWLASAAVSYMGLSTSEQDAKEAGDLPIMVLEIMERLLRWKFLEQRCLGEGMAELTTAALSLRYFLTHCTTTPKQRAVFRRPTIRIMTYALRLSQRRKKHETHFSLSLHDLVETIHWVESEGPDSGYGVGTSGETRVLGLQMFLQSSPPAASTLEDKELLSKVASWAVPVVIQGLVETQQKQFTGGRRPEPKKISEGLPEKLTRWLTASLVLGKLASAGNKLGLTKSLADAHPTCLSILGSSQSLQSANFHSVNKELAIQLLQLQIYFSGEGYNPLITALASLWPFHNPEGMLTEDESAGIVTSLIDKILSNVSAPQEADHSWRWSFNNAWRKKETLANGNVYTEVSSFETEIRQIALIIFQQLVQEQKSSGLARLVSQWAKGFDASSSSNKVYLKKFREKLDHSIEELHRTHVVSQ